MPGYLTKFLYLTLGFGAVVRGLELQRGMPPAHVLERLEAALAEIANDSHKHAGLNSGQIGLLARGLRIAIAKSASFADLLYSMTKLNKSPQTNIQRSLLLKFMG